MRIYPVWYFLADVNSKVSADPVLPNLASIISGTDHTLIPALADAQLQDREGPSGKEQSLFLNLILLILFQHV